MTRIKLYQIAALGALLALSVAMLGAYVRLSNAGLGCPDWPGCYGNLIAPTDPAAIEAANAAYPERQVDSAKAWKEMVHRYMASTLGLVAIIIAGVAVARRHQPGSPLVLPLVLLALVIFQGLLGMWTVTHLVNPTVVTAHLLGGVATLALLWWLTLRQGRLFQPRASAALLQLRPWAWLGLLLLGAQILLGGWTSTNYAALACVEFPTCYAGQWWPPADFTEGFRPWQPLGVNYEFGVLEPYARTAIHLTHRVGALVVLLYLGWLAYAASRRADNPTHRAIGMALGATLLLQIGLGIANVLAHLPLPVAVAHNGAAALLLMVLLSLIHIVSPIEPGDASATTQLNRTGTQA